MWNESSANLTASKRVSGFGVDRLIDDLHDVHVPPCSRARFVSGTLAASTIFGGGIALLPRPAEAAGLVSFIPKLASFLQRGLTAYAAFDSSSSRPDSIKNVLAGTANVSSVLSLFLPGGGFGREIATMVPVVKQIIADLRSAKAQNKGSSITLSAIADALNLASTANVSFEAIESGFAVRVLSTYAPLPELRSGGDLTGLPRTMRPVTVLVVRKGGIADDGIDITDVIQHRIEWPSRIATLMTPTLSAMVVKAIGALSAQVKEGGAVPDKLKSFAALATEVSSNISTATVLRNTPQTPVLNLMQLIYDMKPSELSVSVLAASHLQEAKDLLVTSMDNYKRLEIGLPALIYSTTANLRPLDTSRQAYDQKAPTASAQLYVIAIRDDSNTTWTKYVKSN